MYAADPERFNQMWGSKEQRQQTPDGQEVYEPQNHQEFEEMRAQMEREGFT